MHLSGKKGALTLALTLGLILAVSAANTTYAAHTTRPNILVIMADDQRHDPTNPAFDTIDLPDPNANGGAGGYWMENVRDWFFKGDTARGITGGTKFSRAFATTPSCCPSRASLFTGQYAHNHKVKTVNGASELADEEDKTLQHYLKNAIATPYRTGIFGKYLNEWNLGTPETTPGTGVPGDPPPSFDEFGIFNRGYKNYTLLEGTDDSVDPVPTIGETYSTHYLRNKATQFIAENADPLDSPWLLFLTPYAPHMMGQHSGANLEMVEESGYQNYPVPPLPLSLPANYFEADTTDKPGYVTDGTCCANFGPTNLTEIKERRDFQLRALKSVDDMVNEVMTTVKATGQEQDTLVFYLSDNGYLWGEHRIEGKLNPYTNSIRVPMYARWPGVNHVPTEPGGRVDGYLRANIDIAKTVLDLVGMLPNMLNDKLDGRNLLQASGRGRILVEGFDQLPATAPGLKYFISNRYVDGDQYTEYYSADPSLPVQDFNLPPPDFSEFYPSQDPLQLSNFVADGNPTTNVPSHYPGQVRSDRRCEGVIDPIFDPHNPRPCP